MPPIIDAPTFHRQWLPVHRNLSYKDKERVDRYYVKKQAKSFNRCVDTPVNQSLTHGAEQFIASLLYRIFALEVND
jgi:hypothetical protein